jgi:hypothetical protein
MLNTASSTSSPHFMSSLKRQAEHSPSTEEELAICLPHVGHTPEIATAELKPIGGGRK